MKKLDYWCCRVTVLVLLFVAADFIIGASFGHLPSGMTDFGQTAVGIIAASVAGVIRRQVEAT